jgi:membrane protease YdiL (CAAX protease family)
VAGTEHVAADLASALRAEIDDRDEDRLALVVLALCVAAVAVVEVSLIAQGHVLAGQIADGALLLVLLNFRGRRSEQHSWGRERGVPAAMLALALVPLSRVLGAGLPIAHFSLALNELIVLLPIGFAAVRLAPMVGVSVRRLARARFGRDEAAVAGVGAVLGLVVYLLGAPSLLPAGAGAGDVALAAVAATAAAVVEELVFRGLVQTTLQRVAGRIGLVAAIALFACTYLSAGSASLVLAFALAGVVFAYVVARTGVLGGAIAGHWALSIGAFLVWPAVFGRTHSVWLEGPLTATGLALLVVAATLTAIRRPPVKS